MSPGVQPSRHARINAGQQRANVIAYSETAHLGTCYAVITSRTQHGLHSSLRAFTYVYITRPTVVKKAVNAPAKQ
jgi:hypothetical protein